jgi:arsenite methyltransferase
MEPKSSESQASFAPIISHEPVQNYYGTTLKSSSDLRTSACTILDAPPPQVRRALERVHEEVLTHFYGCGSPIPPAVTGIIVLDLGCGSGRDCYVLSQLVGPNGKVIGVDMTEEQLAIAKRYQPWHAERYGFTNVEFRFGKIEDLTALNIADGSIDLVISNCVLNLCSDKSRVFEEIFRVLRPGGELFFSDVFSDRRIPQELLLDTVLRGECLAGAMYMEDFRRTLNANGCGDIRIVSSTKIAIEDIYIKEKIGFATFISHTVRAFKIALEDRCEDYGQVAIYNGNLIDHEHVFILDDSHSFQSGKPTLVCGNTADMLTLTRYAPYFKVLGNKDKHFGLFVCGSVEQPNVITKAGCC